MELDNKRGRKNKSFYSSIIYENYKIVMEEHCFTLYKAGNQHPLGYYANVTHCINSIINDVPKQKGKVMSLKDFLNEYKIMKDEILGMLNPSKHSLEIG